MDFIGNRCDTRPLDIVGHGQAEVTDILEKMLYGPNGRISHIAGDSNGTKNERKQNIKLVFNFMGKHREIWKQMQKKRNSIATRASLLKSLSVMKITMVF